MKRRIHHAGITGKISAKRNERLVIKSVLSCPSYAVLMYLKRLQYSVVLISMLCIPAGDWCKRSVGNDSGSALSVKYTLQSVNTELAVI